MTKSELMQQLADKLGKSKKEVSEFMDAMVEMAYSVTKKEGEFTISGFGQTPKKSTVMHGKAETLQPVKLYKFRQKLLLNSELPNRPKILFCKLNY